MSGWLLDTNVLSEMRRPRPSREVLAFIAGTPGDRMFVSSITLAEFRFGIEVLTDSMGRAHLTRWLEHVVRPMFDGRVLAVTEDVLVTSRLMIEHGRKQRRTYSYPDHLIAATAKQHGLTVATRNIADFELIGVAVHNPWARP